MKFKYTAGFGANYLIFSSIDSISDICKHAYHEMAYLGECTGLFILHERLSGVSTLSLNK
jgi:hypothetical protein